MQVSIHDYISRAKARPGISPRTVEAYETAARKCALDTYVIDSANTEPLWMHLMDKLQSGVSYFYVRTAIVLVRATMNIYDEPYKKGIRYRDLLTEINKRVKVPQAYNDDQVHWLLRNTTTVIRDFEKYGDGGHLWRALMLMAYSGLRIGGCQKLTYDQFQHHPEFRCYTFIVNSKGKEYPAAIAEHAFNQIKQGDLRYQPGCTIELVRSPEKVSFGMYYREKLTRILRDKANMDIKNEKSLFHSIRKWHSDKLLESPLNDEARGLLLGHRPDSLAFKHYTTEKGISMHKRIAELYSKTIFPNYDFMTRTEVPPKVAATVST